MVSHKTELIEEILGYEAFAVSEGYRKKKRKKYDGHFMEDDSLKVYDILPKTHTILFKELCSSLSDNNVQNYFKLLDEVEVEEVYTLYSIKVAESCVEEYKLEQDKKETKNGRF